MRVYPIREGARLSTGEGEFESRYVRQSLEWRRVKTAGRLQTANKPVVTRLICSGGSRFESCL